MFLQGLMMKRLILVFLLWCGVGVFGSRVRRHLLFSKGSHLFFSVDVRNNLFDYSDFFAQVFGVKMDWELPYKTAYGTDKGRLQRRDLYQAMGHILRRQNLNETSCIRKFLCESSVFLPKSNHFLAQLYEVIFSLNDDTKNTYKIDDSENQCTEVLRTDECPLSLLSLLSGKDSNLKILTN